MLHGAGVAPRRLLADDPDAELARLHEAVERMQRGLDELIGRRAGCRWTNGPDVSASREVLEAYRLVAADAGWLRRVAEVIRGGLTAEAAVQRVAGELRDRMRRITDPYLRERLADIEDLAGRLLAALARRQPAPTVPPARSCWPAGWGRPSCWTGTRAGIAGVVIEEASPAGHAAILARALGHPGARRRARHAGRRRGPATRRCWMPTRAS